MTDSTRDNTHGTPGPEDEADTASGGAPEEPDTSLDEHGQVESNED